MPGYNARVAASRSVPSLALAGLLLAGPARAGKLDLELYAAPPLERFAPAPRAASGLAPGGEPFRAGLSEFLAPRPRLPGRGWAQRGRGEGWRPGDPRDLYGEPAWVQVLSHAGYTGLGIAGLVTSIATGGTAPAIGFGIVTLVQAFRGWRLHQELSRPPSPAGK